MTIEEMGEKIISTIQDLGGSAVSFVELLNHIGDEAKGDRSLEMLDNLVLWGSVSEKFGDAFNLISRLVSTPSNYLVYAWMEASCGYILQSTFEHISSHTGCQLFSL